jgi:hypothetical protein
MSVQMVLLPVFVQVGLTFAILLMMVVARTRAVADGRIRMRDVALREPNWPEGITKICNCFANQLELPVLFYILIALALPLRHADLVIVILSWVFVATRLIHAGVFITTNNLTLRSPAWFVGMVVLLAMWVYFALRILLLI